MRTTIVAMVLAAALSAGMPAKAQYAPAPQEENVLSRLSAETADAMQAINTPWYGERITHIAHRILEFGQPAADVVSQTIYQVSAQNSQWVPVAQQMSQDINRVIGDIQAQAGRPAMPLFQLFIGPGEHREGREEQHERERHDPGQQQAPQYHQEPPQQNRQMNQPQSGGTPQQPPQQSQPTRQAPQAGHEPGQGHPCDDARDPNCREHH
ncbi:hypothetical protein [Telmatospirillum sp.]|uniref:hypothetical protein n=1 Tax=Telmatospirillum sp. TaxID=2079197 RepID=UPI00284EC304|nr:hypothetical protein [Telmatospirillum sp.]MDR3438707.1 hypothetical protein [Telmatospirillum sp.]